MSTTNDTAILSAAGVSKSFQMGDSTVHVLKGVDLVIRRGEFVAIEGRSGSGKSTLLHILGSLESVTEGQTHFNQRDYTLREPGRGPWFVEWFSRLPVLVALLVGEGLTLLAGELTRNKVMADLADSAASAPLGMPADVPAAGATPLPWLFTGLHILWWVLIAAWLVLFAYRFWKGSGYRRRQNEAAALRRTDFGFIFQFYHLLPELDVLENVMFPAMVDAGWIRYIRTRIALRQRATTILTDLGMEHRLKHKPGQLSGGERQRVAIARALMNAPKVLFADEPTGNLDIETGKQIMLLLEELHQKRGQTIVMVTHDRTIARQADRILVMTDGRLHAVADH